MRITGGFLGGRRLKTMRGALIRPTADRVKEAIFGILGIAVAEARVLDLCAGTGALGLEALSRGASAVVFVDKHPSVCRLVAENLRKLDLADRGEVRRLDFLQALALMARDARFFDLVFFDPPYEQGMLTPGVERIAQTGLLRPGGHLVVEASRHEAVAWPAGLVHRRTERYGETVVHLWQPAGHD